MDDRPQHHLLSVSHGHWPAHDGQQWGMAPPISTTPTSRISHPFISGPSGAAERFEGPFYAGNRVSGPSGTGEPSTPGLQQDKSFVHPPSAVQEQATRVSPPDPVLVGPIPVRHSFFNVVGVDRRSPDLPVPADVPTPGASNEAENEADNIPDLDDESFDLGVSEELTTPCRAPVPSRKASRARKSGSGSWIEGCDNLELINAYISLKQEYSFTGGRWKKGVEAAVKDILQKQGYHRTVPEIKNRYAYLKSLWAGKEYLVKMGSGFGWDKVNHRPEASQGVWDNIEKAHRKKNYIWHRNNTIPDLEAVDRLFEGSAQAKGEQVRSLDEVILADAASDTEGSVGPESRESIKRNATRNRRQQATADFNSNLEKVVDIMREPVTIISKDIGSEWISKGNKLWLEEFPDIDIMVRRKVKEEWLKNWRTAQMFVEESEDYRRSVIEDMEDQTRRKRHRRDLSDDAEADEGERRARFTQREPAGNEAINQPVDIDQSLKELEGKGLNSEQIQAVEEVLRRLQGEANLHS